MSPRREENAAFREMRASKRTQAGSKRTSDHVNGADVNDGAANDGAANDVAGLVSPTSELAQGRIQGKSTRASPNAFIK